MTGKKKSHSSKCVMGSKRAGTYDASEPQVHGATYVDSQIIFVCNKKASEEINKCF